ncbi:glutamate-5-semialdehyde dehydrogenase [Alkalitalea saponilacus]|uniref:Gamma-glutamyl phosphate reductase n=1 Tax=Alkalitalea saponilacus TaxID=889453 RepID=A0A1T5AN54_9BACT|nr:glutamate-5-semialdehyde dehydrogenase [Alkalitalea saponilacus]ASB48650.1 glutamate-5-semialdehyde dehydrogenase [Alkalitalea saponilacus]SKB36289.1 glutamate-5-semialdehyde dehydrogenase [Alkalitalea saponilacus]
MSAISQIHKAREAALEMVRVSSDTNQKVLLDLADRAEAAIEDLLAANQKDLERMPVTDPRYDRLKLTEERIRAIAGDLRNVAGMNSPIGEVLEQREMPNGLKLRKMRVALGVVGVIYEARPNVTFDVFALCFRTGNVSVLKGGQDAWYSNQAVVSLIEASLKEFGVSTDVVQLLPPEREAATELMNAVGYVDVLIPRGSQGLIDSVRNNSKVPVIETGAGVVHTYFDETADLIKGKEVIFNAKTRRVSVCNALECLLVNQCRLEELGELVMPLAEKNVVIEADELSFKFLKGKYPVELLKPATEDSWGREHLDYKLSVKVVGGMDEALQHIARYSTKHSEAIITASEANKVRFFSEVDAAAVYANTSTAFTDGAQFGMGAEIGISTQKLHARGPMALPELTSYKWLIESDGLTRP